MKTTFLCDKNNIIMEIGSMTITNKHHSLIIQKKHFLFCYFVCLVCTAICLSNPIQISSGKITGILASDDSSVRVFKGIPFAAPPVENLRWKAPQPVEPWKGVKVMDSFGNTCLQPAVIGGRSGGIRPADSLIVPDVLYKLTHHFAELEGRAIGNQPWFDQGYFICKAMQMTDFTLGRTGVILKSDAIIIIPPRGIITEPRRFYFDRPFLIYVTKREPAASPFFVMWVDNAELMKEFVFEN